MVPAKTTSQETWKIEKFVGGCYVKGKTKLEDLLLTKNIYMFSCSYQISIHLLFFRALKFSGSKRIQLIEKLLNS